MSVCNRCELNPVEFVATYQWKDDIKVCSFCNSCADYYSPYLIKEINEEINDDVNPIMEETYIQTYPEEDEDAEGNCSYYKIRKVKKNGKVLMMCCNHPHEKKWKKDTTIYMLDKGYLGWKDGYLPIKYITKDKLPIYLQK